MTFGTYQFRTALFGAAAALALGVTGIATTAYANDPGDGKSVNMAKPTWDTGFFQAEVIRQALVDLGYDVRDPKSLQNPLFYQQVGLGDVDLWVNGWFPSHFSYKSDYERGAEPVGAIVPGGALQGYLVDKATAERLNISSLEDFKRDDVKAAFDQDGDGKAEMVACPPGWGCELLIDHQWEAFGLGEHVDLVKASYSVSMADAIARYRNGESIFFYVWTPSWMVGTLVPGEDVVWVEAPFVALPEDQMDAGPQAKVAGVAGCANDPCLMGFPANDIRPVANTDFLEDNPAVRRLLEIAVIPLDDINDQNAKMFAGEDKARDIVRHAEEWIDANRETYDGWLEQARQAASS